MHPFATVVASAIGVALFVWFLHNSARSISSTRVKRVLSFVMIAIGIALMIFRAFAFAVPLIVIGISLIPPRGLSPGKATKRSTSQVRTAHLEMTLDHQTGKIDGRILTGKYEGQCLSDLKLQELLQFEAEVKEDSDSKRLLETFLDKTHPDWRDYPGEEVAPTAHQLSREEAYQLLGLEVGSSEEEIRKAYSRLIKKVHPDHGGSAALTAQITEARDRLLGNQK